MNAEGHLIEAKKLYRKAMEEFERAKEKKDGTVLRDACGKGWLSAIEATNAIFVKTGIEEQEMPKVDRGRRYMVYKYAEKELRLHYLSLRDSLHIDGYYEGTLGFDEMERYLDDLNFYIQKVEELESRG